MSSEDLTAEWLRETVEALDKEHPRHWLVLCHSDEQVRLATVVRAAETTDVIEVRTHSFCKPGEAYIMRHPDDFQTIGKVRLDVVGDQPTVA